MRLRFSLCSKRQHLVLILILFLSWTAIAAPTPTCAPGRVAYRVSLARAAEHVLSVEVLFDSNGESVELQLPVWNALYQVRDFSQYVSDVEVRSSTPALVKASVARVDKTTWRVSNSAGCTTISYVYRAELAGPFGITASGDHVFINWALLVPYLVGKRNTPVAISLDEIPPSWKVRDGGILCRKGGCASDAIAGGYDELVDSPVEIGTFQETSFDQGGARHYVAVHGTAGDYDLRSISANLQKITTATVEWMQDRPYEEYTFLYHFPRGPAGGGMEHANSTAIDVTAERLKEDPLSYAGVSAHEFFHLWNVKRLRPQSLEPVDYTREMPTRALWFAEGMTSTVAEHMLVRAGLLDEQGFLRRLAGQIQELESRPARRFQSVEESSLETWFDKYAYYRTPERSVSYYNKGQIVGVLLDLQMRRVSRGTRSIRDLFQYMNQRWAKRGEFYDDSEAVRSAAEGLTGSDFRPFFTRYVAGTDELPYDEMFATVGLRLVHRRSEVAAAGLRTGRNGGMTMVARVEQGSEAENAGVRAGDIVTSVNGKTLRGDFSSTMRAMRPGEIVRVGIRRGAENREVSIRLASQITEEYSFEDLPAVSPEQRARRAAWLRGDSQTAEVRR